VVAFQRICAWFLPGVVADFGEDEWPDGVHSAVLAMPVIGQTH